MSANQYVLPALAGLAVLLILIVPFVPNGPAYHPVARLGTCTIDSPRQLVHFQANFDDSHTSLRDGLRGKHIVFAGDSSARNAYYEFTNLFRKPTAFGQMPSGAELAKREKKRHETIVQRIASSRFEFRWAPFCSNISSLLSRALTTTAKRPDAFIISCGLWDLLHHGPEAAQHSLSSLATRLASSSPPPPWQKTSQPESYTYPVSTHPTILMLSPPPLKDDAMEGHRAAATWFREKESFKLSEMLLKVFPGQRIGRVGGNGAGVGGMDVRGFEDYPGAWAEGPADAVDGVHSATVARRSALGIATVLECSYRAIDNPYIPYPGGSPSFLPPKILYVSQGAILLFFIGLFFFLITRQCFSRSFALPSSSSSSPPAPPPPSSSSSATAAAATTLPSSSPSIDASTAASPSSPSLAVGEAVPVPSSSTSSTVPTLRTTSSATLSDSSAVVVTPAPEDPDEKPRSPPYPLSFLDISSTTESALYAFMGIGLILYVLVYIDGPQRAPLVSHATLDKWLGGPQGLSYWLSFGGVLVYGWWTMRASAPDRSGQPTKDLLHREQTEEWKGWMQAGFLLYHYFKAEYVYNLIRVFISAYVMLTGFGNFTYFAQRGDFSLLRLTKMLFRLNFFALSLCAALGKPFMLYYICPLHTFHFLCVYLTMAILPSWNRSSTRVLVKIFGLFLFLALLFEPILEPFRSQFFGLVFNHRFFAKMLTLDGSMHEWDFRAGLDRYAAAVGMLAAYAYPRISLFFRQIYESSSSLPLTSTDAEVITPSSSSSLPPKTLGVGLVAAGVLLIWSFVFLPMDKFAYNQLHPYIGLVPVFAFITLRNLTPYLRSRVSGGLATLGKVTLETYLLQFHLWMGDDATVLHGWVNTLWQSTGLVSSEWAHGPIVRWINFLALTAVFLWVSMKVFAWTNTLSDVVLPQKGIQTRDVAYRIVVVVGVWLVLTMMSGAILVAA